jgi:hypothetical protein
VHGPGPQWGQARSRKSLRVGNRMKCSVSLIKDTGQSNRLTVDSADALATSIAQLIEENETLRRLAARLSSQLDLARGLAAGEGRDDSCGAPIRGRLFDESFFPPRALHFRALHFKVNGLRSTSFAERTGSFVSAGAGL